MTSLQARRLACQVGFHCARCPDLCCRWPPPTFAAEFENLLDEFLEVHGQSVAAAHEASGGEAAAAPRVSQVGREMEFFGFDDSDAAMAVQKAHEAVQRAEEEAAQEEAEQAAREARGEVKQEREPAFPEPRERERWDCESVLRCVGRAAAGEGSDALCSVTASGMGSLSVCLLGCCQRSPLLPFLADDWAVFMRHRG